MLAVIGLPLTQFACVPFSSHVRYSYCLEPVAIRPLHSMLFALYSYQASQYYRDVAAAAWRDGGVSVSKFWLESIAVTYSGINVMKASEVINNGGVTHRRGSKVATASPNKWRENDGSGRL